MKTIRITIVAMLLFVFLFSQIVQSFSSASSNNGKGNTPLQQEIPDGFPMPHYKFEQNKLTQEGFDLGRKLFYDGRLSKDGNFSCGSCHQQFAAFSTYDHSFSHGFNNSSTQRNAIALFNLAWQKEFHHDGGINHLEVQPLAPLTSPNEMAETMNTIIQKLKKEKDYRKMFKSSFGDEKITGQRILKALAQFTGSIVSADSKYDRMKKGKATFTPYEERGYLLYKTNCASCHPEPLFTDLSYRNIGLSLDTFLNDFGRMKITGNKEDSLKFKVPSLRNISVSAPFMHDGRYQSIKACVEHYGNKINKSTTLDSLLQNGIRFNRAQTVDLIAFLRTLTDSTLLKSNRFSDPENKSFNNIDKH